MGTTTPNFGLYKPSVAEVGWGTLVDGNWDTIDANLTNALPRSYLAGCQLTNNAGSPTTKIDIGAGQAQDAGQAGGLTLAATLTKDISAVWAVGSGNGGLSAALTLTASTWYHVFLIKRTDTGVVDAYYDTSVTAANIPAPYTLFRRLGSVLTDGSKHILAFIQDGDYFRWKASVLDVNTTNPGTAAVLATLSIPLGLKVWGLFNVLITAIGSQALTYVADPDSNDEAPSATAAPLANANEYGSVVANLGVSNMLVRSNTASQVRYRVLASDGNTVIKIATLGWTDTRGRNA